MRGPRYGAARPSIVAVATSHGSATRRRASRKTQNASPSQKTSAKKTTAFRATSNAVEWNTSWTDAKAEVARSVPGPGKARRRCPARRSGNRPFVQVNERRGRHLHGPNGGGRYGASHAPGGRCQPRRRGR